MNRRIITVACVAALCAGVGRGADVRGYNQETGYRLSSGLRIVSITPAAKARGGAGRIGIAGETEWDYPVPPVAGFSPLVAITTSNRASSDDFDWEHQIQSSYVGSPLNAPAERNFVIGLLDTGSSVDLVAGSSAETLGLTGAYLSGNQTDIGGISGTMAADITMPIGYFAGPLGAVGSDGRLDLTQLVGHTNVSALASPAIECGGQEAVTAVLGIPLLAFLTTEIRVDRQQKAVVGDKTYIGPEVGMYDYYTPSVDDYTHSIPIELSGTAPVTTSCYYATFDPYDEYLETLPIVPTSLSMYAMMIPTGGAFFTDISLLQGEAGPLNTLQSARVMVDTGAQSSILSPNFAAKLSLPAEPDFTTIVCGIGGEMEAPGYYIDYVRISALGGALQFSHVPFVVLDVTSPEGGQLDGILGMNFFWNRGVLFEPSITGGGYLHVSDPVPFAYIDLNFDDVVDVADFAVLASAWGTTPSDPEWNSLCDFYLDEVIDARDLEAFVDSWLNMLGQ